MSRRSPYYTEIKSALGINADIYDPRHVEAYMRLEHGTLDGLTRRSFAIEIETAVLCIQHGGTKAAEDLAQSFGL